MSASPNVWSTAVADEALRHLRRLIQFDTTNPPGNELPLAKYLAQVLAADGIESELVEPTKNRAVLCARLRGSGAARPVMLTAHMDVVGVERDRWTTDPFGGELIDGYVYGRGAIDDKGMLAASLMAFLLLKRQVVDRGVALDRDVIFLATSDEESGGKWGMSWIIANHPELVDAEFAFNEGGRIRMIDGRAAYAAVQTAEKVSTILRLRATGPGGHAAIPLEGNAVVRLARAIAALTAEKMPVTMTDTTREFFGRLRSIFPDPESVPKLDALLRDTLSPTVLSGGVRHNVIPTEAEALLSLRTLPGHSPEEIVARLRARIGDPNVELTIDTPGCAAPASSHESPAFQAIRETIAELNPEIITVPYLSTGATESAFLRKHGVQCYGILPFPLSDGDEARMHDHDERVAVSAYAFGVRLLYGTVDRLATRRALP